MGGCIYFSSNYCIVYVTGTVLEVTVRYICDITLSAAPMSHSICEVTVTVSELQHL